MINRSLAESARTKLLNEFGLAIKGSGLIKQYYDNKWAVSVIVDENDLGTIPNIVDGVQIITKKTQKRI